MTISSTNFTVNPVHLITNDISHVGDKIIVMKTALESLGSSGDHIITTTVLTQQTTNVGNLSTKQSAMRGGPLDKTAQRNAAFYVSWNDYDSNMLAVKIAAHALNDPIAAEALILRNGYGVEKQPIPASNPEIELRDKKNETGTVIFKSQVPVTKKKYAIEWAYSLDNGTTWIATFATGVSKREITNITVAARIIGRRRFIIGNNYPEAWVQSSPITVT